LKLLGLAAMVALAGGAAQAENLDAGKSAASLFAASCAGCHSSPRGLAKNRGSGLASFLQEHYTSGPQTAGVLAAYLIANPGSAPPRGKQEPPGRAAVTPPEGASKQTHPQTTTMRPDSMIEPTEPRRGGHDASKGKGKRQQTKQEPSAPAANAAAPAPALAAPAPAAPAAPASAPAAPVAASPPAPDQPAFSAPSP
jgi:hypothetical protein